MPFNMEIDQAFIAAILTVIGYSLNDTVIVFDRVREYLNEHTTWNFDKVVDVSLSSTLGRTLNTSSTTLVVLLAIFIFGGESIRGFMFALIIGIVVGTYSSLFIATPIMYDSISKAEKKKIKS
jgi:SecD/SecF fusion protein